MRCFSSEITNARITLMICYHCVQFANLNQLKSIAKSAISEDILHSYSLFRQFVGVGIASWKVTIVVAVSVIPSCSDDLLLYFSYEDHYNDVTCHHAIATQYGDNVSRVYNSVRDSKVACFGGDTHFEVSRLDFRLNRCICAGACPSCEQ